MKLTVYEQVVDIIGVSASSSKDESDKNLINFHGCPNTHP